MAQIRVKNDFVDFGSDTPISSLHKFLGSAREAECYTESQYKNHQTTLKLLVERVLPHAGIMGDEPVSRLKGHVEQLLRAFALSAGMNERTARTYALRIESLIRDRHEHGDDFDSWRQAIASSGGPRRRRAGPKSPNSATKPETPTHVVDVPPDFVVYVFQLRQSLTIRLPLPRDLTRADVDRLHRWLTTLPLDAGSPAPNNGNTEEHPILSPRETSAAACATAELDQPPGPAGIDDATLV